MTRKISMDSVVRASENQVSSDLGDEVAILGFDSGTYYGLNSVGARVWELIQQPRTVEEVRDVITSEFEVDPQRCERDLITLFERLAEEGLVEVSDEGSA